MKAIKFKRTSLRKTNLLEGLIETIKVYSVIKPLQLFFNKNKHYERKLILMRSMPKNTVGNDIAKMLDEKKLRLIPKFENHDLKHLVLGYKMTTVDEIRMQAYLFGNGNYKISCILLLSSGIIFPKLWNNFYKEYKKGINAPSILNLDIDDCLEHQTTEIQKIYCTSNESTNFKNWEQKISSVKYSVKVEN